MARKPRVSRGYATAMKASPVSSNYNYQNKINPFGPQMACEVFGVDEYDDEYDLEDCAEDEGYYGNSVQAEDDTTEYWYQTSFELENVRELEDHHKREIKKFQRAYRKMAFQAMKWHYLMEEIEDNAQLKKMFNDIQLMRKLGGSQTV